MDDYGRLNEPDNVEHPEAQKLTIEALEKMYAELKRRAQETCVGDSLVSPTVLPPWLYADMVERGYAVDYRWTTKGVMWLYGFVDSRTKP